MELLLRKQSIPFGAPVDQVLTFLQDRLEKGKHKYGSFNAHRSALPLIIKENIRDSIIVKRFMKGIARSRPAAPRYSCTWDPNIVLEYFRTSSDDSLKSVSLKLVTLLALATGERLQTISLIKLSATKRQEKGLRIFIEDPIKSLGVNSLQPCLEIPNFLENPNLCVATILERYIEMTSDHRNGNDKLFLTYKNYTVQPVSKP
ncbi:hypothetical protein NQ315_014284 [Exocentrus adspersus]|uniref:Tyr recombinase domain-containing protein n=1 Tax=Exocentrus adspersus TaxID=1586481 RepID=A0AAV8VIN8_9CUCU|nr:hypothetical protein NQ315_014284 [Exocentrus adspersus]